MSTLSPKNLKATGNQKDAGLATANWQPMLQRHVTPQGKIDFVIIRVRILSGDTEHDFNARFQPGALLAYVVCKAIGDKEGVKEPDANIFRLWVVSKDLELQIRPQQDIFELMVNWNQWVLKYTHVPEALDPSHAINRHWFVYRREAGVTLEEERKCSGDMPVRLLYGEAKRNFLTGKYICSVLEGATLGAIQLQVSGGDFDPKKHLPGFLWYSPIRSSKDNQYQRMLPPRMHVKQKDTQWEGMIVSEYRNFSGLNPHDARVAFLELVRSWPCYGCSFFPACRDLPPSGFFEHRVQKWVIGANFDGLVVIDLQQQKYVHIFKFAEITWAYGPDKFYIQMMREGKLKEYEFISPQSPVINNVAARLQYKWSKKVGNVIPIVTDAPEPVPLQQIPESPTRSEPQISPKPIAPKQVFPSADKLNNKIESRRGSRQAEQIHSVSASQQSISRSKTSLERIATKTGSALSSAFQLKSSEERHAHIIPVRYQSQEVDAVGSLIGSVNYPASTSRPALSP